jgi:hypothetical protein
MCPVGPSFDALALRLRVGATLADEELAFLDRAAREGGDLGSWMLLRVGQGADALAAAVAAELGDAGHDAIIRGACELRGDLRHAAWHVLAWLAEERPAAVDAIESAISSWPARDKPWMQTWLNEVETGAARSCHRLARNLGLVEERLPLGRIEALLPALASLRELDLAASKIDAAALHALVAAEALGRLEVLSLERAEIDDDSCKTIANESKLHCLSRLIVDSNPLTANGLARLIRAPRLPHLRELNAAGCKVDLVELAQALGDAASDGDLRPVCLDISQCSRASEGVVELAHRPALRWIGGLDLHHVAIEPEAARALAQSSFASSLQRFSVNQRSLGEKGVRALLEAPWLSNIKSLNLFNQKAGDGVAPALRRLSGGAIEQLELMHQDLGLEAARALGAADLSRLRELRVSHNLLGDEGVAAILSNPTLTSLEVFEASDCGADAQTARELARAKHFSKLRILQLGDQHLGCRGTRSRGRLHTRSPSPPTRGRDGRDRCSTRGGSSIRQVLRHEPVLHQLGVARMSGD